MANKTQVKVPERLSMMPSEVQLAFKALRNEFGAGSIKILGDDPKSVDIVGMVPTGSLALDLAIGAVHVRDGVFIHGVPRGRTVEVYGPESCGKTTFCNEVVAHAQDQDGLCAFIDMEQAWDKEYASKIGVDTDALTISQPSCAEEALTILETLVMTRAYDVIVLDSIASLVPQSEIDAAISGNMQPGTQARMMSSILRKINPIINASKTCVIFTNQLREKIGVMFGNPETTPGGRAMKFYATLRLEMRPSTVLKDAAGIQYGHTVKIVLKKNKIAAPYRVAETALIYGQGFDILGDIVDLGCQYGIIEKRGAWFSLNGEQIGQGKQNVVNLLEANPDIASNIEQKILKAYMGIEDEKVVEESEPTEVQTS